MIRKAVMKYSRFHPHLIFRKLLILKKAMMYIKNAAGIKPDYTALKLRGKFYLNFDMFKEAIALFERAVRINPNDAESYYHLGNAYHHLGMFNEAVKAYKDAISKKSRYFDAIYDLSVVFGKSGRWKEAVDMTKRALSIKPNASMAFKNLAIYYEKLERLQDAIDVLKKAVYIDPDDAKSRSKLAQLYLGINDRRHALQEYYFLKKLSPEMALKLSHQLEQ